MSGTRLTFSQRSITLDGKRAERADWGAVSALCPPSETVLYLNVAIAGHWRIRNAPLWPGSDAAETIFYFDLGVKPGMEVQSLHAATSLTPEPARAAPEGYTTAEVVPVAESYWTNFRGKPYPPLGTPPSGYEGAKLGGNFYCRLNYPNQPCGKNECAPAAVSNSMQWLNKEYGLGIDPKMLTIDYWKDLLHWDADGVAHGGWVDAKVKFTNDARNGIPIQTTKLGQGKAAEALKEFTGDKDKHRAAQAIEVDIGCHVAAVVCMSGPDENGHYHINAASDAAQKGQKAAGDPVIQQIEITANGDVVSGPPWAFQQDGKVKNFVVQCPRPKAANK